MKTTEEKFWKKVRKTNACWLWMAGTNCGYGRFALPNRRNIYAHRWAYESLKGPIPDGLDLDHLCRVRNCVNPDHLEPVTSKENILRGIGPTAINARKTHCNRGHEFTDDTLYITKTGAKQCLTCKNLAHNIRTANNKFFKCGHPKERNTLTKTQGLECCQICHDISWEQRRRNTTHCQRGHDFNVPGNMFIRTDGRRQCAICHKVASDRANAKKLSKR